MDVPTVEEPARLKGYKEVLGGSLFEKILSSKVLVVGAGGIGCELLKNLVLSGFSNIETIDLDTIDTSNLNRQFLFRKQHVGQPKAVIAREAALKYNPAANIKAHFGNVKTDEFGPEYMGQFDLVMNALDNLSARRHVNRMCLAADVPLIESGTAGYLGQVQVIRKGVSECFECNPHPTPKTFPVCTIRNNPSTPIHCIVWAKYIFERFFGPDDTEQEEESRAKVDEELNKELNEQERKEIEELNTLITNDNIRQEQEKQRDFGRWFFHKLFHSDVLYISTLKSLWRTTQAPKPISLDTNKDVLEASFATISKFFNEKNQQNVLITDQRVWSPEETAIKFLEAARKLQELQAAGVKEKWEKDNALHLDFVTAAANLRACIFHIDLTSRFSVKEQAGNIIPAIATTNAIVAGLIVMKAFQILDGKLPQCRHTYLKQHPNNRGQLFLGVCIDQPNPQCYVCGGNFVKLQINTTATTLGQLVEEVAMKAMNMIAPVVMVGGSIVFEKVDPEEEPEDFERNSKQLLKTLSTVGINHNTIIYLEDDASSLKVEVSIYHQTFEKPEEKWFEIQGAIKNGKVEEEEKETANGDLDDDIVMIGGGDDEVVMMNEEQDQRGTKRARDGDDGQDSGKRQRTQ